MKLIFEIIPKIAEAICQIGFFTPIALKYEIVESNEIDETGRNVTRIRFEKRAINTCKINTIDEIRSQKKQQ